MGSAQPVRRLGIWGGRGDEVGAQETKKAKTKKAHK